MADMETHVRSKNCNSSPFWHDCLILCVPARLKRPFARLTRSNFPLNPLAESPHLKCTNMIGRDSEPAGSGLPDEQCSIRAGSTGLHQSAVPRMRPHREGESERGGILLPEVWLRRQCGYKCRAEPPDTVLGPGTQPCPILRSVLQTER